MPPVLRSQKGMVLLASLVFLMVLGFLGLSAMERAGQQEKMAGAIRAANQSFQGAEAAMHVGETWLQAHWSGMAECASPYRCAPPVAARSQRSPGLDPQSGINWVQTQDGLYGIQFLGLSIPLSQSEKDGSVYLYRITGIGLRGLSRTVLESVYARHQAVQDGEAGPVRQRFRRVMWRQIQ